MFVYEIVLLSGCACVCIVARVFECSCLCLSVYVLVLCVCVCLSVCWLDVFVCLPIFMRVCLFDCVFVRLWVRLRVCLVGGSHCCSLFLIV